MKDLERRIAHLESLPRPGAQDAHRTTLRAFLKTLTDDELDDLERIAEQVHDDRSRNGVSPHDLAQLDRWQAEYDRIAAA